MSESVISLSSVVKDHQILSGGKMKMAEIFNLPLVFTGWVFDTSKFSDADTGGKPERVTLQFELNGEKHIVFSSSKVLIDQLHEFIKAKPEETKFSATIRRIDKFEKFC